jgi:hypothetical protein
MKIKWKTRLGLQFPVGWGLEFAMAADGRALLRWLKVRQ